jgi:methyl-accepting chemotaxis protein
MFSTILNKIQRLTAPPFFGKDAQKNRKAKLLNVVLWTMLILVVAMAPFLIVAESDPTRRLSMTITFGIAIPALMGMIVLMHRGKLILASSVLSLMLLAIQTTSMYLYGGIRNSTSPAYLIVILAAGLLINGWGAIIFGVLSIGSVLLIYGFETGVIGTLPQSAVPVGEGDLIILGAIFSLMAVLLGTALRSINSSIELAQHNERSLAESNRQLNIRSRDLERRSRQLQAAAEVSRAAISAYELDGLLAQVTLLISEQFNFYHAGIFLLDEAGEYAVLQAANSTGGKKMLEKGHRLKVDEQGVVGYVTGKGRPRIALDVGKDAVHFDNPMLPETRSELALPLKIGSQIIGALDVQSKHEAAFDQDDITVLQTMADQLAIAIENARLLQETQKTVHELSAAAAEMLAVSTQQMSGAHEQSAAINQTTTTVEEVRVTSEHSVERARDVVNTSQRTVDISRVGKNAVRENISGMTEIKERVQSIAENILALSEQTQQIGEIIASVNDIAVQSNLLALNASIEAARAGEHGKGFAIVAAEVRNLAQQSRLATTQIKAILSDIQQGINMTVTKTEEGTSAVDRGVQLVAETQKVIEQLTSVIEESAQVATQMVTGGQQQAEGVKQIALAMQNINQATQQSLVSARQVESTAQDLNDLSLRLTETVEQHHK